MTGKIIPDVVSDQMLYKLPPTASARDAAKVMGANKVSAVLVTDGERLVGIFTERDLTSRVAATGLDPDRTSLAQVMTPRPDVLAPDDSPLNALEQKGGFVGIGLPHPVGSAFGVAHVVAELRPFAANVAFSWHWRHLLTMSSIAQRAQGLS